MPLSNPCSPNLSGPEDCSSHFDSPPTPTSHQFSDALWSHRGHGHYPKSQSWAGAWDLCLSKPAEKEPGLTLSQEAALISVEPPPN